jgi:hypothetical protein
LANRILNVITAILAWPLLPVQIVTTFVGGCLVSCTFGLLLIPLSFIWMVVFLGPLLGLSWLWDKTPILRVPLAMVGIPLAALGTVYVALIPSMGETESRAIKLVLFDTWPFSLDYWRSLRGVDVPDFDRLARIKQVMWGMRVAEPPDTDSDPYLAKVIADGSHIANGWLRLARMLGSATHLTGELRPDEAVGAGPNLTIQAFSRYRPDDMSFEFTLTDYHHVGPDVIRFNKPEADFTWSQLTPEP